MPVAELEEIREDEIIAMAIKEDPITWAMFRRRLRGKPMRFTDTTSGRKDPWSFREFLVEPLQDTHPRKCRKKARQIGETETGLTEIFWILDTIPFINVMYILPTRQLVEDFSNARLRQALNESPYMKSIVGTQRDHRGRTKEEKVDNVTLKAIGRSHLFMRPASTRKLGEGTPVDFQFVDEKDSCPSIEALSAHEESLSSSRYGWIREWSTPTIPDYGISETYNMSDQREWYVKCRRCGKYQLLTFPSSLVCVDEKKREYEYQCEFCKDTQHKGKPIIDRYDGIYVSQITGIQTDWRGYFVNQLAAPWISATKIMYKKRRARFESLFWNYVLGMEYLGDNVLVTDQDIEQCIIDISRDDVGNMVQKSGKIIKGTDWGKISWQICGIPIKMEGMKKLLIYDIRIYNDDDENMHTAQIRAETMKEGCRLMVNDAGYGRSKNRVLLNHFPRRVFSCFYPTTEFDTTNKGFKPVWSDDQSKVSVHRTTQIKYYLQQYRDVNIVIPTYLTRNPNWLKFKKQHTNLVVIRHLDEKKQMVMEKIGKIGEDHYGHAGTYLWTAFERVAQDWKSDMF